jgi:hypothetical protein
MRKGRPLSRRAAFVRRLAILRGVRRVGAGGSSHLALSRREPEAPAGSTTQPSDHSSVCTAGKLGCFELSVGPVLAGTAADGPIVTTLRFAGVGAAAGLCSGLSAGAGAVPGRDRGIGGYDWYEFDRLISPGGRGGPASSKKAAVA